MVLLPPSQQPGHYGNAPPTIAKTVSKFWPSFGDYLRFILHAESLQPSKTKQLSEKKEADEKTEEREQEDLLYHQQDPCYGAH
ncbi:conserved hypothetical protein [Coccidioides posadasii str. Silveira]|uniref:Uncharacterized protein n=1 Tax=Coccidioides posadasii (strain RMSCC 757 / Silveira) TaxID=443226 RepID=E9CVI5_COCPS|nr:conserved hypothetical protein [Coccidioides posadasii str. Silveira]